MSRELRVYLTDEATESFEAQVLSERKVLETSLSNIESMLRTIRGTPPFQGMIRADKNGGFDSLGNSTHEEWRDRLATIFASEMNSATFFGQLRYLDVTGQEVVRVDLKDGAPVRVAEADLQYKGDRSYMQNAEVLTEDTVYVSPVSLNREGVDMVIEIPYVPVIRYVFPIFDEETGVRAGSLVGNVLFDELMKRTVLQTTTVTEVSLIDAEGYYLLNRDTAKLWGSGRDLDTTENFFKDFPGLVGALTQGVVSSTETDTDVFAFAKVFPNPTDKTYYLSLIQHTPKTVLFGPIEGVVIQLFVVGAVAASILAVALFFVIRLLLRPLKVVTAAAKQIGKGEFEGNIKTSSRDEIGLLARAINTMSRNLRESYSTMQSKVEEQTNELADKVGELENTKRALINVLDDVEEARRIAEVEEKKTAAILGSIGDGLVVLDEQGRVVLVNKVFEELLGWKQSEVVGKVFIDVVPLIDESGTPLPKEKRLIAQSLRKGVSNRGSRTGKLSYQRKDGSLFPVAISTAPVIVNEEVRGAVEVFRDITQEAQIDKAKTEFVSLASHQLRTPLTAVRWYVEMLLSEDAGALNTDQMDYVREIAEGNHRMIDLVNALLNVSRIELGTFAVEVSDISIPDLVSGIAKDFTMQVQSKKQTLSINTDDAPEVYPADPKLLGIVFQNLLSNAIKYTPEGGTVSCRVTKDTENVHIAVSDTGYGIPKEQQDKIFSKLFRADNVKAQDTTGTGLGLYIVKAIVEQSGGSISFESAEGKGTTFTVTLPQKGMTPKEGSRPLEAE
ncbi:cell wall metabolism sensor histidine kinase WalK [Candidatus Kaiserbacteria bacterium]|nr:cell wall metabolism sensor histidine kinase WalK [Candidatus Kaiserbacteria bacterium]